MRKKRHWLLLCICLLCFTQPQQARAAEHPYAIAVNLTQNIVTVYEKDAAENYTVPIRAFLCSGGEETPEGTFRTTDRYTWRLLFGNVYGQYATRITGHILFHSVPYLKQDKSTLESEEYNKLGESVSAGCIRLTVADAKWIYENCPAGTMVRMYRGEKTEPLQPNQPQKIDLQDTMCRGWDPTDPDPANPWLQNQEQPIAETQAQPKQESAKLTMQTKQITRTLDAYQENGQYFVRAKDMRQIFAHMGITLVLSEKVGDTDAADTVTIWYRAAQHTLTRQQRNGQAYYNLRELTELTGVFCTWNEPEKKMALVGSGVQVLLFETAV